jgi:hypothetical protein
MKAFRVWIRALGDASRVRVEGNENAHWLLGRLSQSFVFKSSAPVLQERGTPCCTFEVFYGSQTSRSTFERLLAGIPEVQLMAGTE